MEQNVKKKAEKQGVYTVRGRTFVGKVISAKMRKTVVCEIVQLHFNKKYQRNEKRRKRIKAHNPDAIQAQEGDIVRLGETRPISKTKACIVIEKIQPEVQEA